MVGQLLTDRYVNTLILHTAASAVFPSCNPYLTKHDYLHLFSMEIINFANKKKKKNPRENGYHYLTKVESVFP